MNTEQIPQDIIADLQKVGFHRINDHSCTFRQAMVDFARLREQAALSAKSVPVAFMRRWAFDGETPAKFKDENGRWKWPYKYKLLALTQHKLLQDDVVLYAAPQQADKVRELEKDAERYRWLCENKLVNWAQTVGFYFDADTGIDQAIDQAMKGE